MLPKPTGITNELAKERNRAAAERTLTSWIQNSIALIGFGIAFDEIFAALQQSFPQDNWTLIMKFAHLLGLTLIGLGIALQVLAMIQYHIEVKSIEVENYITKPTGSLNLAVSIAIVLFGLGASIAIWL
ncbi:MAG: YidH family protein [Trichodesmium sp.]